MLGIDFSILTTKAQKFVVWSDLSEGCVYFVIKDVLSLEVEGSVFSHN